MPASGRVPKHVAPLAALGAMALLAGCVVQPAAGPTREQFDAVLVELRAIRMQLAGTAEAEAAPTAPAAAAEVHVSIDGAPTLGDAAAKVALVAYMDVECGFCRRFHLTTFPEIKRRFVDTGQLRFVVKDFPLPMHEQAVPAANALACTRELGGDHAYWKFYEALFANSTRLTAEIYPTMARDVGVAPERLERCLLERRDRLPEPPPDGISGTPSFVLGRLDGETVTGSIMVGAQPFGAFEAAIEGLLKSN